MKAKDLEKELRSDDILESEQEISDYMTQEFERLDVDEE